VVIPPIDPPMTAATEATPSESRTSLWILENENGAWKGGEVSSVFRIESRREERQEREEKIVKLT